MVFPDNKISLQPVFYFLALILRPFFIGDIIVLILSFLLEDARQTLEKRELQNKIKTF